MFFLQRDLFVRPIGLWIYRKLRWKLMAHNISECSFQTAWLKEHEQLKTWSDVTLYMWPVFITCHTPKSNPTNQHTTHTSCTRAWCSGQCWCTRLDVHIQDVAGSQKHGELQDAQDIVECNAAQTMERVRCSWMQQVMLVTPSKMCTNKMWPTASVL